jgi:hypothetical protein
MRCGAVILPLCIPLLVLADNYVKDPNNVLSQSVDLQSIPTITSQQLLRSSSTRPITALDSKSNTSSSTLRLLQRNNTAQQIDNAAAAYLKCYSLMDQSTSDTSGIMTQTEYVTFLMLMTDGMINLNSFADLSAIFVLIFYTAACSNSDCSPGNVPQVDIGNTDDPNDTIQFMCQQTLKSVTSTAETVFEYTIRYSTSTIEEGDLATCLSTATVNVLLKDLAACPVLTDVNTDNSRRMERRKTLNQLTRPNNERLLKHRQAKRDLQGLGSAMTDADSMCDYEIMSTVERFTELRKLAVYDVKNCLIFH